MNSNAIRITRTGHVTDRATGRDLGWVHKIDWPRQIGGIVEIETRWEARRPHQALTVSPFSFPTFTTRREAAQHLAGVA